MENRLIELELNRDWTANNKHSGNNEFQFFDSEGDPVFKMRLPYEHIMMGYDVVANTILDAYLMGQHHGVQEGIVLQQDRTKLVLGF